MICNICGVKEATIHLTEIVNNQMMEIHICEECAKEKGTDFKAHFNFNDMISGIMELEGSSKKNTKKKNISCDKCGMKYEEFVKSGRLGCAECYKTLRELLSALIKRVHKASFHVGKKPKQVTRSVRNVHDLRLLQEKLKKSITKEEFEEAVKIRDKIKQIEEKK